MLLMEALQAMKEGKCVVRDTWSDNHADKPADGYLTIMPGMKHIWKILPHPTPNAGNHLLSLEELEATDWSIKVV